jgi:dsDNA-specific endonuclease/ATPase MutS2
MNIVHSLLEKSPLVESYRLAPPEAGSWGATIAYLKEPFEQKIKKME